MARITPDVAERMATLARLELSSEEVETLTGQLERVLEYVEKLREVDTTEVEPTVQVGAVDDGQTPLRDDEPVASLDPADALANAPATADGAFVVPRILESE